MKDENLLKIWPTLKKADDEFLLRNNNINNGKSLEACLSKFWPDPEEVEPVIKLKSKAELIRLMERYELHSKSHYWAGEILKVLKQSCKNKKGVKKDGPQSSNPGA